MQNGKSKKIQTRVAALVKNAAEFSVKNAVGKKFIYVVYEPEVPEAVKEFVKKESK